MIKVRVLRLRQRVVLREGACVNTIREDNKENTIRVERTAPISQLVIIFVKIPFPLL